jgi:hypothetical protein
MLTNKSQNNLNSTAENYREQEIVNCCELKGLSYEIGEGCIWCYWIDLKFVRSC